MTRTNYNITAVCNSTRGVVGGGNPNTNVMDFMTIATLGNAQDFGDLLTAREHVIGGTSSKTRGVFSGGNGSAGSNVREAITISTTGNSIDFGDCFQVRAWGAGCSNGHGGL